MKGQRTWWASGILLGILGLSGCVSLSKAEVKTPADAVASSSAPEEEKISSKNKAYKPLTGHMDGVEFYINKDLASNGLESEKDELRSIFDDRLKPWNPQKGFNIPMVRNQYVDKWISFFTGPVRTNFERWIRRGSHYVPIMEPILREYGLPTDLIYLSMIESGFNTHAYSSASAAGLWQFIPGTGRMYGLEAGNMIDERRDIVKATRAAAAHLRDLYKTYGDWYLAFAAYNSGAGTVNRALAQGGGTRNFWALAQSRKRLFRQETKDYVPRILAAAIVMKNYKKYGFSSSLFERPLKADEVQVNDAADLAVLADCARVSFDEMKDLNPSLVGCMTPAGRKYSVYVPEGASGTFQKNYEQLAPRDRVRFLSHKVKKHETIQAIAKHYRVSADTIMAMNGLRPKAAPRVGTVLRIPKPGASTNFLAAKAGRSEPVVAMAETAPLGATGPTLADDDDQGEDAVNSIVSAAIDQDDKDSGAKAASDGDQGPGIPVLTPDVSAASQPETQMIPVKQAARLHKVKKGDTLASISKKYKVTLAQLRKLNGGSGTLKVGQAVKVSAPKTVYQATEAVAILPPPPVSEPAGAAPDAPVAMPVSAPGFAPAVASGSSVIQPLNPAVAATAIPVVRPVASAAISKRAYKVQSGDTLDLIARKNGTTVSALMKANGFTVSSLIRPGQTLKLSGSPSLASAPSAVSAKDRLIIHAVRKGETLWTLSRKYGVTVGQIKNWNKLVQNGLQPNQKIRIYVQARIPAKKMASL